jgi:NAD(P)-dependent dehydrogenase (short-subunit alcohol dehydrogenase family)
VDRRLVLVTGGAGRVAAQLTPGLRERYDLRLVDHADGDRDVPLIVGELTDDRVLDQALAGTDSVVHLAGNPHPDAPWRDLHEPNVHGFVQLLDAARRHRVRRVVFASSVHAMGAHEGSRRWPVDPARPPAPCCAYGATKAFDEALARMYAYRFGLSSIGLRLGYCTPRVSPAEAVAGWTGPADLRDVVIRSLETDVRFGVYHAVSWASRHRWDIGPTIRDLGYEPERTPDPDPHAGDGHLTTCTWSP